MPFSPAYAKLFSDVRDSLDKEAGLFSAGGLLGPTAKDLASLSSLSRAHIPGAAHTPGIESKVLGSRSLGTKAYEAIAGHNPEKAVAGYLGKENRKLRKLNKQLTKNPLGEESNIPKVLGGGALGAGGVLGYNSLKNQQNSEVSDPASQGFSPAEIEALRNYYGIG